MKIGSFTFTRQRRVRLTVQQLTDAYLQSAPGRIRVGRIARGEVKNYLAELAEETEMPFGSPAAFLQGLRTMLAETSTTNLQRDPEDPYDPEANAPYTVTDRAHTVECPACHARSGERCFPPVGGLVHRERAQAWRASKPIDPELDAQMGHNHD